LLVAAALMAAPIVHNGDTSSIDWHNCEADRLADGHAGGRLPGHGLPGHRDELLLNGVLPVTDRTCR
jgi:hypothetical protein